MSPSALIQRSRTARQPGQREAHPVRTVRQLVAELVEELLQLAEREQALRPVGARRDEAWVDGGAPALEERGAAARPPIPPVPAGRRGASRRPPRRRRSGASPRHPGGRTCGAGAPRATSPALPRGRSRPSLPGPTTGPGRGGSRRGSGGRAAAAPRGPRARGRVRAAVRRVLLRARPRGRRAPTRSPRRGRRARPGRGSAGCERGIGGGRERRVHRARHLTERPRPQRQPRRVAVLQRGGREIPPVPGGGNVLRHDREGRAAPAVRVLDRAEQPRGGAERARDRLSSSASTAGPGSMRR